MKNRNCLGYETLSPSMMEKIVGKDLFPKTLSDNDIVEILTIFNEFELNDPSKVPDNESLPSDIFPVDNLIGKDIDEHFHNISKKITGNLKSKLSKFCNIKLPTLPSNYNNISPGWNIWDNIKKEWQTCINGILEDIAIFDVETFVQSPEGNWSVLGTAVTEKTYYIWAHEAFLEPEYTFRKELIDPGPFVKILIGHNVCFDHARVKQSYSLSDSPYTWIDTRSMFNICHGLTSDLMTLFDQHGFDKPQNPYSKYGAKADLVSAYNFYYRHSEPMHKSDKKIRDVFVKCESIKEMHEVAGDKSVLMDYAIKDTYYTFKLFSKLFPEYLWHCPSEIALAAMAILGNPHLPLDNNFWEWFENCEKLFHEKQKYIGDTFREIADKIMELYELDEIDIDGDPWISQLDWSMNTLTTKKTIKKYKIFAFDGTEDIISVSHGEKVNDTINNYAAASSKEYEITKTGNIKSKKIEEIVEIVPRYPHLYRIPKWYLDACAKPITTKSNLSHYLLGLKWQGKPVIMTSDQGWCTHIDGEFKKVPHKKGPEFNVGNMLTKDFISYYEKGFMEARNEKAKSLMDCAISCSYWLSVRSRVANVLSHNTENPYGKENLMCAGEISPHNTISGRGGQRLWYTVPGAKSNKIGTEIKTRVAAPEGWSIVGGDIDGQELQIFSMYADTKKGVSGSSPVAYSVILGNKSDKTEPHWLLAKMAEIDRKDAKTINYGIQYGAGFPTIDKTLAKSNPIMDSEERRQLVNKILKLKKGDKIGAGANARYQYGMDSDGFNYMLDLISEVMPRTPFLETLMSEAIQLNNDSMNRNFTSVQNWTIQRSGADFLSCMIVACKYLSDKYSLGALFSISLHDEIFFLVPSFNKEKFAACFLMAHIWTWSFFHYKLGLYDVPLRRLFISGIYVGNRWSKSLDSTQTISNPQNDQKGCELTHNDLIPVMRDLFNE